MKTDRLFRILGWLLKIAALLLLLSVFAWSFLALLPATWARAIADLVRNIPEFRTSAPDAMDTYSVADSFFYWLTQVPTRAFFGFLALHSLVWFGFWWASSNLLRSWTLASQQKFHIVLRLLDRMWKLLVLSFVFDLIEEYIARYYLSPTVPSELYGAYCKSQGITQRGWSNLWLPTFQGSSALVLALVLILLARFIADRERLATRVGELENEASLTV